MDDPREDPSLFSYSSLLLDKKNLPLIITVDTKSSHNAGWILSQVGKAYFELVDYLYADYAFSLACQISPDNLE
ncbi:hypothetical protein GOBAR_AA26796 [Gossypium barbadense]|uniref:Uncharacterized protein n=1 Tax=Gossypium barbadense TaxID=3634 RepID=A0A2P5WS49_GOSBA|nr:hypothetical protein GOBAR_AA26796 [Gossypium barbadense]